MPSLWRCRWPEPAGPDRQAVHRTLSRWLDGDHHAQHKPWSWVVQTPDLLIGLLDDRLAERLRSGADAVSMPVAQVVAASWAELRSGRVRDSW